MKMIKLYKEVKGEIETCNCQDEQLESMEKSGWTSKFLKEKEPKKELTEAEIKAAKEKANKNKLK